MYDRRPYRLRITSTANNKTTPTCYKLFKHPVCIAAYWLRMMEE